MEEKVIASFFYFLYVFFPTISYSFCLGVVKPLFSLCFHQNFMLRPSIRCSKGEKEKNMIKWPGYTNRWNLTHTHTTNTSRLGSPSYPAKLAQPTKQAQLDSLLAEPASRAYLAVVL